MPVVASTSVANRLRVAADWAGFIQRIGPWIQWNGMLPMEIKGCNVLLTFLMLSFVFKAVASVVV